MTENKYTLTATSGALIGVGLTRIDTDLVVGLGLVGAGVALQILVAVLNKFGIPVSSNPQG